MRSAGVSVDNGKLRGGPDLPRKPLKSLSKVAISTVSSL